MWAGIARSFVAKRRRNSNRKSEKLKRDLAKANASRLKFHIDDKGKIMSMARRKNILHSQIIEAEKKERAERPKQTILQITKHEARQILNEKIAKNPFMAVIDKERFCRARKEKREEIMRKTGGKGLKIKKAVWTPISKLIKCERKH